MKAPQILTGSKPMHLTTCFCYSESSRSNSSKESKNLKKIMKGQHVNKESRTAYLTYDFCIAAAQYGFKRSP